LNDFNDASSSYENVVSFTTVLEEVEENDIYVGIESGKGKNRSKD
jgi:hypothetical protein